MKSRLLLIIWLSPIVLIVFLLYALFFPSCFNKLIPNSQFIILALTLLALLYYAYQTHKLAHISQKALDLNVKPIFDIQRDEVRESGSRIYLIIDVKGNYPVYFSNFKVKLEAEDKDGRRINPIERDFKQDFWLMKEDAARHVFLDMEKSFKYLDEMRARNIRATITVIYRDIEETNYTMNKQFDY